VTYLDQSFSSLLEGLPTSSSHPLWNTVKLFLVNNFYPGKHEDFNRIKDRMKFDPRGHFFEFYESTRRLKEQEKQEQKQKRSLLEADEDKEEEGEVGFKTGRKLMRQIWGDEQEQIRRETQQTLDLCNMLTMLEGKSEYYLFMEDDMTLCPAGMEAIMHAVDKANRQGGWRAIRFSFGLNGILIKNSDIPSLRDYWMSKGTGGPSHLHSPDMLVLAYWAPMNGGLLIFKGNLMEHKGVVSTFEGRDHGTDYLKCWETNKFWPQFHEGPCQKDDLQPCRNDDIYVAHGKTW